MTSIGEAISGALFSDDQKRRYKLWRVWDRRKGRVLFIGLNPSKAGERQDDPTIRRCIDFAKQWGYGGMFMGNLFSIISPYPYVLLYEGPVDDVNYNALCEMWEEAGIVVGAWGIGGLRWGSKERSVKVREGCTGMMCLSVTKSGEPGHPLYLPKRLKPVPLPLVKLSEEVSRK